MEDVALITRCQQGDSAAFESLYRQQSQRAVRTAYLIVGQKAVAEDAAQEAFIQCFREIGRLRNPKAFEAWFYRILVRICWRLSEEQRKSLSLDSIPNGLAPPREQGELPHQIEHMHLREAIDEAVTKLGRKHKTVVILRYFNDLSVKEIGKVLGCRVGTVKSRLHEARKRLLDELKESGLDDNEQIGGLNKGASLERKKSEVGERSRA